MIIKHYGDSAATEAAMRADAMLDKGDLGGRAVWLRILRAVNELLAERPCDGEPVHRGNQPA